MRSPCTPLAAVVFSVVHFACMLGVRALLWPGMDHPRSVPWTTYAQRQYLSNLDWTLMTYAAIAGLSYALAYHRESQEQCDQDRKPRSAARRGPTENTARRSSIPHFLFNTLHAISTLIHVQPESPPIG